MLIIQLKKFFNVIEKVNINTLQFHGDETPEFCQQFNKPYIKALRIKKDIKLQYLLQQYQKSCGILLDSYTKDNYGGTGKTFDWNLIDDKITKPIILAGGISSANVLEAVQKIKPYAIDISSGVEKKYGIKDKDKIYNIITIIEKK